MSQNVMLYSQKIVNSDIHMVVLVGGGGETEVVYGLICRGEITEIALKAA